jgi:hypothetical protein
VRNEMFKGVNTDLVVRISSVAHIDNRLWVKVGIKPVIHSPFPVNDNIRRDCITNSRD